MLRSIDVYYAMGVMGKRKYIKVCQSLSFKKEKFKFKKTESIKVANYSIPAPVPYYKLVKFLKGVDIGNLYSVEEHLCDGPDKVNGFFVTVDIKGGFWDSYSRVRTVLEGFVWD